MLVNCINDQTYAFNRKVICELTTFQIPIVTFTFDLKI